MFVGVSAEADHLAAEHAPLHRQLSQLSEQLRGDLGTLGDDLDARLGAVLRVVPALEDERRLVLIGEQVQAERHGRALGVRADGHAESVDLALAEPSPLALRHQVAQRGVMALAPAHTQQARGRVAGGDLGQGDVEVGPPVHVDALDHHRQLVRGRREVCVQLGEQRGAALGRPVVLEQLIDQARERRPELLVPRVRHDPSVGSPCDTSVSGAAS